MWTYGEKAHRIHFRDHLQYCAGSRALYSDSRRAEAAKLDRVLDLLEMSGGKQLHEIGCGWGSLADRVIGRYGCALTSLTISAKAIGVRAQATSRS
jgi:cyclopropane fatty-acyl-phospholipid synthase-like methyltransferase